MGSPKKTDLAPLQSAQVSDRADKHTAASVVLSNELPGAVGCGAVGWGDVVKVTGFKTWVVFNI